MEDPDLIGMDYLWRVITNSGEEIANRAIEIMREVNNFLENKIHYCLFILLCWKLGNCQFHS